jgi:hypothetical protein
VGHGPVALALTAVIVILVCYLAVTRKDVEDPRQAEASAASSGHRHAEQQPGYPPSSRSMPPYAARPDPPLRYPGQYPDERYPGERYQGQRGSGQQYPDDRYAGEQYQTQQYPDEWYREERHPGQRYPQERYPREQYPEQRDPRQPPEPRPPQERRPSRQSRQAPEPWPDEDEAEQTAWGFFMWDE